MGASNQMTLNEVDILKTTKTNSGFTLIELLIVVAIIGILAAIAVPNFVHAQVRAKLARVYADMTTLATALEAYKVDHQIYPYYVDAGFPGRYNEIELRLIPLTTPIPYLPSVSMHDPYLEQGEDAYGDGLLRYHYNYRSHESWGLGSYGSFPVWVLNSIGPDHLPNKGLMTEMWARGLYQNNAFVVYDITNGLISDGDIPKTGGDTRFIPPNK
jgi:general secretion pathway protein G